MRSSRGHPAIPHVLDLPILVLNMQTTRLFAMEGGMMFTLLWTQRFTLSGGEVAEGHPAARRS